MKVQDLIDRLKEFPPDMEVVFPTYYYDDGDEELEPVSEVEMVNFHGNTVRIG